MSEVVILLSIENKENQRLLQEYLSQYHTIHIMDSAPGLNSAFDLAIFDGAALSTQWEQVYARKQSENPLFLPILMVTNRAGVKMITRQLWRSIDEIIFTPIEKIELLARVEVLLRARRTSLELASRNIELRQEVIAHRLAEEALRLSEQRARLLQKVTTLLVEAVTREKVLQVMADNIFTALGSHAGLIRLVDASGKSTVIETSKGFKTDALSPYHAVVVDANLPTTRVIQTAEPLWIENQQQFIDEFPHLEPFAIEIGIEADVILPFLVQNGVIGAMALCFPQPQQFTEEEKNFLQSVAQQCSNALERVRLYEEERERVALEERQRLGRDLHDSISQSMFSIHMLGQSVPQVWESNPARAKELLQELTMLTEATTSEIRVLLLELRPASIVRFGMSDLLHHLVNATRAWRKIPISCHVEFKRNLPDAVHVGLYRITQEALNNIVKHSKATEGHVSLSEEGGKLVLRIRDNGLGFNPEDHQVGLGITGMKERAALMNAQLEIRSVPGGGTEVEVSLPSPAQLTDEAS